MQFGIHLVRTGVLTADEFIAVLDRQLRARPTLGELAIETRKLSMRRVFAILSAQAGAQKSFGEVALEKGYLSRAELAELLALQCERCKPLHEVIAEMGLLDGDTLNRHLHQFRSNALQKTLHRETAIEKEHFAAADHCVL